MDGCELAGVVFIELFGARVAVMYLSELRYLIAEVPRTLVFTIPMSICPSQNCIVDSFIPFSCQLQECLTWSEAWVAREDSDFYFEK